MTSEEEARSVIGLFRAFFGAFEQLEPVAFIDRGGDHCTTQIYRNPRPLNMCKIGVKSSISMNLPSTPNYQGFI